MQYHKRKCYFSLLDFSCVCMFPGGNLLAPDNLYSLSCSRSFIPHSCSLEIVVWVCDTLGLFHLNVHGGGGGGGGGWNAHLLKIHGGRGSR